MSNQTYKVDLFQNERDALVQLLNLSCALSFLLKAPSLSKTLGEHIQNELEQLLGIVQPALWDSLDMPCSPCYKDTE